MLRLSSVSTITRLRAGQLGAARVQFLAGAEKG